MRKQMPFLLLIILLCASFTAAMTRSNAETGSDEARLPASLLVEDSAPDQAQDIGPGDIEVTGDDEILELLAPDVRLRPDLAVEEMPEREEAPGLISVSFDEVPVPDVVNMFSRISGANIIVAGVFTNYFVTANLRNVEWRPSLDLLLGSVGLSTIEDPSGIIMVVTSEMYQEKIKQLEDVRPLVTRVFRPQYLNPVDLVQQVREMNVLSARGAIMTSQSEAQHLASLKSSETTARPFGSSELRQNPSITTAVVVTDIKEYVERVGELLQYLDRREPQVLIEARVIDIVSSDSTKLGFDWGMLDSFGVTARLQDLQWSRMDAREARRYLEQRDRMHDTRTRDDVEHRRYDIDGRMYEEITWDDDRPVITPTRSIDDTISRGREITMERGDIVSDDILRTRTATALMDVSEVSLFLSALEQTGNAKMLSHPLLIVGNRVEAKIHVGVVTWRITLKRDVIQTGAQPETQYSEEAETLDLGLKLWVIPEIDYEQDVVRLTVNPEMTVFVEDIITAQGSVYPVTSTRALTTRVNVPSGETLVIGGLIEYETSKREKKVPFLGDIPVLGLLFRHKEDVTTKHNLVVMLTPTILDETAPATGYEAMGWQAIEGFDVVPLSATKSPGTPEKVLPAAAEEKRPALIEPEVFSAPDVEDSVE